MDYAQVQWFLPDKESPVLDLLNLRYIVGFGSPQSGSHPAWSDGDYFITERPSADTRVFVPKQIETIPDSEKRLARLTDGKWNPRNSLILESEPATHLTNIQGTVHIVRDDPEQVEIEANMQTPGYVLLADRWDPGWKATVNGQPTAILRADHAFRAVAVPSGVSPDHLSLSTSHLHQRLAV